MTTTQIRAPFTSEQVAALNRWQEEGPGHPFTCGSTHATGRSPLLDATHSGWICPDPGCDYTQDWALAVMADPGRWPKSFPRAMTTPTPPDAARTPCSFPECDTDSTGEPCATHEEEQAHAAGQHEFCGVTCEVAMPTEAMRNTLLAWAPAGGASILAELERRAGATGRAAGLLKGADPVAQHGLRLRDGTLLSFDDKTQRDRRMADFVAAEWQVTPLARQVRPAQYGEWAEEPTQGGADR